MQTSSGSMSSKHSSENCRQPQAECQIKTLGIALMLRRTAMVSVMAWRRLRSTTMVRVIAMWRLRGTTMVQTITEGRRRMRSLTRVRMIM